MDIACISEVRIIDNGHSVIKAPGGEACRHLYHSGVEDNSRRHDVAIAFSKADPAAILAWAPISSRLASARMKRAIENLTVMPVDALTFGAAKKSKDCFYYDLRNACNSVPAGNMLIVAGDWNARPGPVAMATWYILGKFAPGLRCTNGDSLVHFASANHLVVSSTRF